MSESRSLRQIAERLLAVSMLKQRSVAESCFAGDRAVAEKEFREIGEWVLKAGLERYLEPEEKARFERPLGQWSQVEFRRGINSYEALGTLLWSVSLLDRLPAAGECYAWDEVSQAEGPLDTASDVLECARLRPRSEVRQAYEAARSWIWRVAVAHMIERGMSPPSGPDWPSVVATAAANAERLGHIPEIIAHDFPVFGKPFHALTREEFYSVAGPLEDRYAALLWLCGVSPDWATAERISRGEEVPPDDRQALLKEEVAYRALALGYLLTREIMERAYRFGDPPTDREAAPARHMNMLARLREQGIEAALSPNERDLIFRPLGLWTEREGIDVSWRYESLGCLLWALSLLDEVPPYDVPFDEQRGLETTVKQMRAQEFIARARLRSPEEIAQATATARLWAWRAEVAILLRRKPGHALGREELKKLPSYVEHALRTGTVRRLIDGDLPAHGRAVAQLDEDETLALLSCTRARFLAFALLNGGVRDWDSGPDREFM